MVSYIGQDKTSSVVFCGGHIQVSQWAKQRVTKSPKAIIIIIKYRPSKGGRVIAEIDCDGGRVIIDGRKIINREIVKLSKRCKDG